MSDRKGKIRYETVDVDEAGREVGRESGGGARGGGSSSHRESSSSRDPSIRIPQAKVLAQIFDRHGFNLCHQCLATWHKRSPPPQRIGFAQHTAIPESRCRGSSPPGSSRNDDGSKKKYHERGAGCARGPPYDPASAFDTRETSSAPRRLSHSSNQGPPSMRDWAAASSSSQLPDAMTGLTVNEAAPGSPQYTYESSYRHDLPPIDDREDDRSHARLLPPSASYHDSQGERSSRSRGKGKGPSSGGGSKHRILGSHGQTEKLNKNYAKRNLDYTTFFRPGRIFSTPWTEPYDDSTQSEKDQTNSVISEVRYGEKVYTKIRRFVVVKKDTQSCTCVPVTTYNGKGYRKRGIDLNHHGLIYSSWDPPLAVKGISKEPLRIILSPGAERLVNPSYLNYGRVYTIEMNVKVWDIGELEDGSRRLLRAYYKSVQLGDLSGDEETAPNPQQRAVEVAGMGAVFANTTTNSGSGKRGADDWASIAGGYNQPHSWNQSHSHSHSHNPGGDPAPMSATPNPYAAQPSYSSHALGSGFPSVGPPAAYQQQQQHQHPDTRYAQDPSSTTRGAPPHRHSHSYHPPDPRYATQPFYAPFPSSAPYPGWDHDHPTSLAPRSMASPPAAPDPSHPDSRGPDVYPAWTAPAHQLPTPFVPGPDEILLPTAQEAELAQTQRRAYRERDGGRAGGYYSDYY